MDKVPIYITWLEDKDGKLEPEISLTADDFIDFESDIIEEIQLFKKEYNSLLESVSVEKLKQAAKSRNLKRYWSMCKKLAQFNEKMEAKFVIMNMKEAYMKDLGLSTRGVRNCLDFVKWFKRKDVLDEKLPFWSYSNLAERATNLTKLGLFKKEIEFLINAAKDGSLPTEKDYRIRLNEIVSGGIC